MNIKIEAHDIRPIWVATAIILYNCIMTALSWGNALITKKFGSSEEITHAIGFDSGSPAYEEDEDDEDDGDEEDCEDMVRRHIGFCR